MTNTTNTIERRARLAGELHALIWMSETDRTEWTDRLRPGTVGVDDRMLEEVGVDMSRGFGSEADRISDVYVDAYRAAIRAELAKAA